MYNFLLQIIIMSGLGVMIYLVARTAPRIGDDVISNPAKHINRFDKFFSHEQFEKFDALFNNLVEKGLRKTKLILMKLDNLTNEYLDKVKKYKPNGNGKKGIEKASLFERSSGENAEEAGVPEKTDINNM